MNPDPGQPRKFPTPALDRWHEELRQGKRSTTDFDALWSAASAEQWALDYAHHPATSEAFRRDAVKILRKAAEAETKL